MKAMSFLGLLTKLAKHRGDDDDEMEDFFSEGDSREDLLTEDEEYDEVLEDEDDEEEDREDPIGDDVEEPVGVGMAIEDDLSVDGGEDDDPADGLTEGIDVAEAQDSVEEPDGELNDGLIALPDDIFSGVDEESDLYILASVVEEIDIEELKSEATSLEAFLIDLRAGVLPEDAF